MLELPDNNQAGNPPYEKVRIGIAIVINTICESESPNIEKGLNLKIQL